MSSTVVDARSSHRTHAAFSWTGDNEAVIDPFIEESSPDHRPLEAEAGTEPAPNGDVPTARLARVCERDAVDEMMD